MSQPGPRPVDKAERTIVADDAGETTEAPAADIASTTSGTAESGGPEPGKNERDENESRENEAGENEAGENEPNPTLLEQMGGISGLIYSSVPVLVFVGVYLPAHSLAVAIWASVGSAVAILAWRLIRREPVQPAISGLFGVAIAAFIAYRTGSARGYFLFGIWSSLLYGGAFLVSIIARWPLAGVVWSVLNSTGMAWRRDKLARRYYDIATVGWVIVFGARFIVQHWLYDANQVGWLGVARIGMGWPLTGVAALLTVWAVRQADLRVKELTATAAEQPSS